MEQFFAAPRRSRRPVESNVNERDFDTDARDDRKRGHKEPELIDGDGNFNPNEAVPNLGWYDLDAEDVDPGYD